ncbi:hypothetical protein OUZ56_031676 [Daphnia magna]|uniref:Uncharacterized protein n=1 Tax=Daphnia magna TaxID=35525 RepID=A0ABQ9ZUX2_9CRUS|nr:hypothetical protein OUZ56_031676 [Daphnia magna]
MFRVKSMKWLSQKRTLYYFCTGPNSVYVVYAPLYNPINFRLRSSSAENLFGKQILNKELGGTVERKIFAMGNLRSK